MVIRNLLARGVAALKEANCTETPALDARLLLCRALGLDEKGFILRQNEEASCGEEAFFMNLVARRKTAEPVAYILGEKEFFGLSFLVDENVLIPRPDTEILVEWALANFKGGAVLDIGTGSGCIAITLAKHFPKAKVFAADISPAALAVAQKNAARHGVDVAFLQTDILHAFPNGEFNLIVSNQPYIRPDVLKGLSPDVREFEPHGALAGGGDGLVFYRAICQNAPAHLAPGGLLAFEIGFDQANEVCALMEKSFTGVTVVTDLAGCDRVVCGALG